MTWRVDLEQLPAALAELRSLSPHFASLTSPPLTVDDLRAFERNSDIELPDSYRAWLLALGERPIVPGLVGSQALALADCTTDPVYSSFAGRLNEPFPHTGVDSVALCWDEGKDNYADEHPLRGTVCLGSAGCDQIWVVVVTGADRGSVWTFTPFVDEELSPTGQSLPEWNLERISQRIAEERRYLLRRQP